jgi:hypothetical protein
MTRSNTVALLTSVLLTALSFAGSGCVEKRRAPVSVASFEVTVTMDGACGTGEAAACPYSAVTMSGAVTLRALREDGTTNTDFGGTVILALVPAGILDDADLLADGRHVRFVTFTTGIASNVSFSFTRAFGAVRVMVEDIGYRKADNVMTAACYDRYPATGCYALDDDDPDLGTGAAGVSEMIRFEQPTLYDLQATDQETVGEKRGYPSPLDLFRPTLDAEGRDVVRTLADCVDGQGKRRELIVVTSTTVTGFTITDVCNAFGSDFAHAYIYNFNTPEGLGRGDCLRSLTGTIAEFQGYTELKNPFWVVDCDPEDPSCAEPRCTDLLPAPVVLDATRLDDLLAMEKLESALVTVTDVTAVSEFRRCDLNGNGALSGDAEWACSRACGDDVDCVVKESYDTYFQWSVNKDGVEVNVVSRGVLDFDPELNLGVPIRRITGTIRSLSFGRPPWTIEVRDDDDFEL